MQEPLITTSYGGVGVYCTVAMPLGPKVVGVKSTVGGTLHYLVQADGSEFSCDPQTADWWRENLGKDKLPWE